MPSLIRKLLIYAAVDGLVLQPVHYRSNRSTAEQSIKIEYKGDHTISPVLKEKRAEEEYLEGYGIVGLLKISSLSYLVSISRREQVAVVGGKPVYTISEVALIPLSSQADAAQAITRAHAAQQRNIEQKGDGSATEGSEGENQEDGDDNMSLPDYASLESDVQWGLDDTSARAKGSSVAEDVISRRGVYGRFAEQWFSRRGWQAESRRKQGLSLDRDDLIRLRDIRRYRELTSDFNPSRNFSHDDSSDEEETDAATKEDAGEETLQNPDDADEAPDELRHTVDAPLEGPQIPLLHKFLTVSKLFLGSKSFFFSYDYDLSRSVASQSNGSSLPMWRIFDPLYFWNRHLVEPFIDSGHNAFVMPIIQGFVGQREFTVDTTSSEQTIIDVQSKPKAEDTEIEEQPNQNDIESPLVDTQDSADDSKSRKYLLTLISRRSVKRAGLRYLRRGIDEEGNVANSVETEQILSPSNWDGGDGKLYSYLQCRGSIPLFFSQSPYSLKPIPLFHGSSESNAAAFKLHFQNLMARYGQIQAVSLVEKKATEVKVGELYQEHANRLNESNGIDGNGTLLKFEWFDFHAVCKGMRFENVSVLFDILGPTLSSYGWTIQQNSHIIQKQSGILRTNCMDCLDRTNVVQSACGRGVLEQQLADQDVKIDLQNDPSTSWFNTLWADNGDAISRQYSGTAALKGDFTRTRHRNISGALTDFGLTLTRYYNNIVNDYFAQAVIDFLLGRADESIFVDFEADMKAQDYAIDLRKVRQTAIDTCVKICIESSTEELLGGWTLRCPAQSGTLRSLPLEECVLLLTGDALYFCRMDWTTEKVRAFERVELECVKGLIRGIYITSTLAKRDLDEARNVGFVIQYSNKGKDLVRVNTRSMSIVEGMEESEPIQKVKGKEENGEKFLAFKTLPSKSALLPATAGEENDPSEGESIKVICEEIARVVNLSIKGIASAETVKEHIAKESVALVDGDGVEREDQMTSVESPEHGDDQTLSVKEKDIISVAEAKKSTGYLETLGYSLKKLVWAS